MQLEVAIGTMFLAMTCAVFRPRMGLKWRMNHAFPLVTGVLALFFVGILEVDDFRDQARHLWQPLLTIASIMVMSAAVQHLEVLDLLASRMFSSSETSRSQLFRNTFILSACTSSVLNNDAMIMLLTPMVIVLVRNRYGSSDDLQRVFAFTVFSSVGVAPLVVSNPINMIVAHRAGLNFNEYAFTMIPVAVSGWIVVYFLLKWYYRKVLADSVAVSQVQSESRSFSQHQIAILLLMFAVVLFYPLVTLWDGPVWIVALSGAAGSILLAFLSDKTSAVKIFKEGISWDILIFLLSVVFMAAGLRNVGVSDYMARLYGHQGLWLVGSISAVGSALLNNHTVAHLNTFAIEVMPGKTTFHFLAALIGGDLGPRLIPVGSLAGLLWIDACRRRGLSISLIQFITVGAITVIPAFVVSIIVLQVLSR